MAVMLLSNGTLTVSTNDLKPESLIDLSRMFAQVPTFRRERVFNFYMIMSSHDHIFIRLYIRMMIMLRIQVYIDKDYHPIYQHASLRREKRPESQSFRGFQRVDEGYPLMKTKMPQ